MEWEPDWDDLDKKADGIVARYALVSGAWNILPPPLDMMGVTATFAKMATELAGVYQVMMSAARARQMGWAIATGTASVLGVAFAGGKLVRFIPGGGWLAALLLQAPVVGAVAWAAGDALKDYFKQTRKGVEPSIHSLRDSFARTLHIRLKKSKNGAEADKELDSPSKNGATSAAAADAGRSTGSVTEVVEKIAAMHELLRQGAITQDEFDAAKTDLLKRI